MMNITVLLSRHTSSGCSYILTIIQEEPEPLMKVDIAHNNQVKCSDVFFLCYLRAEILIEESNPNG